MTRQEVIEYLEKSGYKPYPVAKSDYGFQVWNGSKRCPKGTPECDTNEDKVSWHVKVSDWCIPNDPYHRDFKSVEIEIVGGTNGLWFKLTAYSINFDDLKKKLFHAEISLLDAWISVSRTKEERMRLK